MAFSLEKVDGLFGFEEEFLEAITAHSPHSSLVLVCDCLGQSILGMPLILLF